MEPRKPTEKELQELAAWVAYRTDSPLEEIELALTEMAIVVFAGYVTGSPGYYGKLLIVVSDFDPAANEIYMA